MLTAEVLQVLAARGVDVTVFMNVREPLGLRYKWEFSETRDTGIGIFKAAGYELRVWDLDGDQSEWELRRGKAVLAEGSDIGDGGLYHFDACLLAAEAALSAEVKRRLSERP